MYCDVTGHVTKPIRAERLLTVIRLSLQIFADVNDKGIRSLHFTLSRDHYQITERRKGPKREKVICGTYLLIAVLIVIFQTTKFIRERET